MKKQGKKLKGAPSNFPRILLILLMMIWVGAAVIASQLIVGYLLVMIIGRENFNRPVWTAIYSALAYILAMCLIIFVPKLLADKTKQKTTNNPKEDRILLGLRGLPTWSDVGLAPAGFIIYLIIASVITWVFSQFPWFNASEVQTLAFSTYTVGFDRVVAFLTLVVVAPIAEEIIFRGWLYGKMRGILSSKISDVWSMILSIFLVSLLFGIVHLQWNVGVNVFAMSVVMCGLREVTGTIYAGILLHMIKNGVAFYLLYVLGM